MGTPLAPQRKDVDAAYAAAHGIRVPSIFAGFEEARDFVTKKGGTVIFRSEHPLELEGLSGLNMSPVVSPEKVALHEEHGGLFASFRGFDVELFEYMMRAWHRAPKGPRRLDLSPKWIIADHFCQHEGIEREEYLSKLTYSFWEYIEGHNLYVIADPAIPRRYRIFARWPEMIDNCFTSYDVFDGTDKATAYRTPQCVQQRVHDIVALYEYVREIFAPGTCPIVEMQLSNSGELYFLQRSAGPRFKVAGWSFASSEACDFRVGIESGYGEVVGTTPEAGIEVEFLIDRGTRIDWLKGYRTSAILSSHIDSKVIEQKIFPQVAAYIETHEQIHGDCISDTHGVIIPLTRSPLYLFMPEMHERFPERVAAGIKRLKGIKHTGHNWYVDPERLVHAKIRIRSDGKEARIDVLEIK